MTKNAHQRILDESAALPDEPGRDGVVETGVHRVYNRSFETRFQKGVSGNPSGRKPGSRNKRKIVEEALDEKVTICDGARIRKMSKFKLMVTQLVNDAAKGNHKAWASVLLLIKAYNLIDKLPEPDITKPLTADDDALIADFRARLEVTPSSASDDEDQPSVVQSKPEKK